MRDTKCVFCGKDRKRDDLIEGVSGNVCKACVAVCSKTEVPHPILIKKKSFKTDINITQLKQDIDAVVVGQEKAKQQLIMELYKRYKRKDSKPNNVLLVGDSGVGKTHIVRSFAHLLKVPFLEVDATTFSATGYKGNEISEMLNPLIETEKGDKERVEKAIVFIDELDKLTSGGPGGESGLKVQQSLLKMIEGTKVPYATKEGYGTIDTSNIMFVGAGACVGLDSIRKERQRPSRSVGFRAEEKEVDLNEEYIGEDLIEFGFIPELVGRFPLIVELSALERDDIKKLLTTHPDSLLTKAGIMFADEGITLAVTADDIERLADECVGSPLGVRAISHKLTKDLNERLFQAILTEQKTVPLFL